MTTRTLLGVVAIVLGLGVVAYATFTRLGVDKEVQSRDVVPEQAVVTNFEECVAAGNPVMESYPAQCLHDGNTYVQVLSDDELLRQVALAAMSEEKGALAPFIQFSQFPCTTRDGMGGPPKCMTGEAEGTIVEALPVIDGEGTHIRKGSKDTKTIVRDGTYYGQYRVTDEFYGDADFPKGAYAIILKHEGAPVDLYSILHITDGKIIRIDGRIGELSLEGLEPLETDTVTSADNAPPGSIHNLPVPQAVAAVKTYAAQKSGVSEGLVIVMTAYQKDWSDGCLGLGGPAEGCLAAITPGYEVTVSIGGVEQTYRTNADGSVIRREQ